jgi:hypothetical protein
MQARRYLAFLAAILITVGQAVIFAADTAASAQSADASIAAWLQSSLSSDV